MYASLEDILFWISKLPVIKVRIGAGSDSWSGVSLEFRHDTVTWSFFFLKEAGAHLNQTVSFSKWCVLIQGR